MWTRDGLRKFIEENLGGYKLIVVSNREPYRHHFKKGEVICQRGAGGVITALDPVMKACHGVWIANGDSEADKNVVNSKNEVMVPPEDPKYTLKRVWLTKEEETGFYFGFSNEAIWPLCHIVFNRPHFREEDWKYYKKVNQKFAKAVLNVVGDSKAFIWIQDYHLALLPKYLKEANPNNIITAHFWHIPWPNPEVFRICPKKTEILEGLLANDLLSFHIKYHCDNFITTVEKELEAKINKERLSVIKSGHETLVKPFPISVDFENISEVAAKQDVIECMQELKNEYSKGAEYIMLGLDRIDYTKGIPERILAIGRFFEKYPEFKKRVVFIQMGELSRIHIPKYKQLNDEINRLVEEVNWKHGVGAWTPIVMVRRHLSYTELLAFYRMGNLCIVSSLHDGMNLVCKEYISSKIDNKGMLLLSKFTGASREFPDAIEVNPFDIEEFAEGIKKSVTLKEQEIRRRMKRMRSIVKKNNIYRWAGKEISELFKLEFNE